MTEDRVTIADQTPIANFEGWSHTLDLRALAGEHGTPLYIHDPATLRANLESWVGLVGDADNVRYPVKANPSPVVLDELARHGCGADIASRVEMLAALNAGIPLERISYTTPAMDIELAVWLLEHGATVVIDAADVVTALHERLAGRSVAGAVFLRVNPGGLPGYRHASDIQKYTSHGSGNSQFGIPSEDVVGVLKAGAPAISGLHMHVGTQMDNVETFVEGLGFLHALADIVSAETEHRIDTLNLGGGLGIPFLAGQEFPAVSSLVTTLRPRLRADLRYQVEPGNALVGNTMALLTRIVSMRTTRGRRWAIIDVGTDQLVKFTVARWEHEIVGPDHVALPREGPDAVAGPLCFAGDVLLPATRLDGLRAGDPLLIRHAGAYCEAVASRFNGRAGPPHAVRDGDGSLRVVRHAEDPFYDPAQQTYAPAALFADPASGTVLDPDLVEALHSPYMRTQANEDVYVMRDVRRTGERSYVFSTEPGAAVGFVAMPLALRIVGDAAIIAVGHQLGWTRKEGPVWATRLSMAFGAMIPATGRLDCRIVVGKVSRRPQPGISWTALVRYRLGDGQVHGVARVVVPDVET